MHDTNSTFSSIKMCLRTAVVYGTVFDDVNGNSKVTLYRI